jgi:hypothetical protein
MLEERKSNSRRHWGWRANLATKIHLGVSILTYRDIKTNSLTGYKEKMTQMRMKTISLMFRLCYLTNRSNRSN